MVQSLYIIMTIHQVVLVLETSSTGVRIYGTLAADYVTGDGSGLSNLPSPSPSTSDVQIVYELTGSSSSSNGYRISGNAVDSSTANPDLYLVRGKKYRFINNSGGNTRLKSVYQMVGHHMIQV